LVSLGIALRIVPTGPQLTLQATSGNAACYFQPFIGHSSLISADFSGQTR